MIMLMEGDGETKHQRAIEREGHHRNWVLCHRKHLVRTFEIIRESNSCLYFVMENMTDGSIRDYIAAKCNRKLLRSQNYEQNNKYVFDNSEISTILFQAFRGLCYMHSKGMVHRDIKPDNILLKGRTVKLADFSLARAMPMGGSYCRATGDNFFDNELDYGFTEYIGTRWYRAPEILRRDSTMTTAIDVFSMGCVAAELYLCHPIFPGRNETEQLELVENLLSFSGRPHNQTTSEQAIKERLSYVTSVNDSCTVSFLYNVLNICPEQRPATEVVLRHEYFEREWYFDARHKNNQQQQHMMNTSVYAESAKKSTLLERTGSTSCHD